MQSKQNTLIPHINVNKIHQYPTKVSKTKYIDTLHERKQNKIHRYPTNVNKTKYIDILKRCNQNKIH